MPVSRTRGRAGDRRGGCLLPALRLPATCLPVTLTCCSCHLVKGVQGAMGGAATRTPGKKGVG